MEIWGTFPIENRRTYLWRIRYLLLWLFRDERQWYWTAEYSDQPENGEPLFTEQVSEPEGAVWRRLITRSLSSDVVVAPMLPDRPVVVMPQEPLSIGAGVEVRLYFALPLWVQLRGGERLAETLGEFGVAPLSNTWLGDTFTGRMSYMLRAPIGYEAQDVTVRPGEALCCLHITNSAETTATLDKLAIPCDIMALYRRRDADAQAALISNEILLNFGRSQELQVRLHPETPKLREDLIRLTEPRQREQDSFWHKSISLLKKISEY